MLNCGIWDWEGVILGERGLIMLGGMWIWLIKRIYINILFVLNFINFRVINM